MNLDGFPIVEFRPLYKIIYACKDSYSNTPHASFTSIVDLRSIIASDQGVGTTPVSDHGSMTGLSDDDHPQYLRTDGTRTATSLTVSGSITTNSFILDGIEIDAATPSDTNVLKYDAGLNKYIPGVASTVASLDDLTDVIIDSATPNQVLKFDGTNWVNSTNPTSLAGTTYSLSLGDGINTEYVISHNLSTRNIVVSITEESSPYGAVSAYWEATDLNSITVYFASAPEEDSIRVNVYASVSGDSVNLNLEDLDNVGTGSPPTSGSFLSWNGSQWVDQVIELGNNTTGNYVSDVTAGTGVTVTHTPGEGSSASIAIGQAVGIADNVTFNNINVSSNISLTNGGEITASRASTTDGGSITIKPEGIMDGDIETGGSVYIYGGYAYGSNSVGGSIEIDAGNGLPDNGQIIIGNTYANLISIGRSGKTTQIEGSLEVGQTMSFQQTTEKVNSSSITSNIMTCDYTTGAIYYQSTNPSANFTVNFTNVPTTDNKAITFTIFVTQGATGYIPSALQIDGSAQTIKWAQGTQPTPTANKIDIFSFTLIRLSSSWTVFGNANTNF